MGRKDCFRHSRDSISLPNCVWMDFCFRNRTYSGYSRNIISLHAKRRPLFCFLWLAECAHTEELSE